LSYSTFDSRCAFRYMCRYFGKVPILVDVLRNLEPWKISDMQAKFHQEK